MTRYTNLGKKRTYVEAGFDHDESSTSHVPGRQASPSKSPSKSATSSAAPANEVASGSQTPGDPTAPQPRKHRRRHRSKKGKGLPPPVKKEKAAAAPTSEEDFGQGEGGEAGASERTSSGESRRKKIRGLRQPKDGSPRTTPPGPRLKKGEIRRLKRISEKDADTTCFACREKGHAARDCPKASEIAGPENGPASMTGICYRCGSQKHTLSKCKTLADPENPLPFASCFVCSGKGHLAGSCPQNQNNGVYPNGGSCKICGDTTHLAKECTVRKNEMVVKAAVGTGFGAGADEDDFMVLKRRTTEVERQEHVEERRMQVLGASENAPARIGGQAGVPAKKVVVF
ncbi:hypothetical protein FA13DRAFT_1726299 [Coprinellus micaceus]|uniref:CCHC-type domain-containing protein n=1 Tax=Coprinellus micaceus TaxID=71717 RepID=A0A4Y7TSN6_COPMI|nr:hypothetical protein FA13DRAFT_1726299 [Coprinellus micaceus]